MAFASSQAISLRASLSSLSRRARLPYVTPNDSSRRIFPSAHASRPRTRPLHSSPIRPKQSLGQNFLQDENIICKIVAAFDEHRIRLSPNSTVVEIGAGTGALTSRLISSHPDMLAVEIDSRAVDVLQSAYPTLEVNHSDVLQIDWNQLSTARQAPLAVIGNLPYNIVSQILFSMLEARRGVIGCALVMMQKEVAERVCARIRTKSYGILSVVGQLYAKPTLLFDVPCTAFYPKPSITSTMVLLEFEPNECLDVSNTKLTTALRNIVRYSFQQRRKTIRNSLRTLCTENGIEVPEGWGGKRPEELSPQQFVELTKLMFGDLISNNESDSSAKDSSVAGDVEPVWRARPRTKQCLS